MKEKIFKFASGVLYVLAGILFIGEMRVVITREHTWMGMILAVLICPGTYYVLRRKFRASHPIWLGVFRGITLGFAPIAMGFILMMNPYYRCFDFSVTSQAKEYFNEHIRTDQIEYRSVSSIQKPEHADYRIVTAMIEYEDRQTKQKMHQEVTLYFDRINGDYFNSFEEMRQYRREHAEEYLLEAFHFDELALNDRVEKIVDYFIQNDYAGIQQILEEGCKEEVTEPKWAGWNQELSSLGSYRKTVMMTPSWQVGDDAVHTQTMDVTMTLQFVSGTADLTMTLNEDLKLEKLSLSTKFE